jgi:hypothetical protein
MTTADHTPVNRRPIMPAAASAAVTALLGSSAADLTGPSATTDSGVKRREPARATRHDSRPADQAAPRRLTPMAGVATPTYKPQSNAVTDPETGCVIDAQISDKDSDAPHFRVGVSAQTFRYLDHYTWWRVVEWMRKRHYGLSWGELHRRHLPGWEIRDGQTELFRPQTVATIRYRYRGSRIPTPWASNAA